MNYSFHPVAEAEHFQAIQFYEARSKGLGMDYLLQFEAAMLKVMDAPERFRIEQKPDIRRALLMRFPYKIIYRLLEGQVQVLATAHKRRQPGYWLGRI